MASEEPGNDAPSIAPPSIGLGLRRRKRDPAPDPVAPVPEPTSATASTIFDVVAVPATQPVTRPEPAPRPEPEPVATSPEEQTQVIAAAAVATTTLPAFVPAAVPTEPTEPDATATSDPLESAAEKPRRRLRREKQPRVPPPPRDPAQARAPRDRTAPAWLDGRVAAMVAGLVVGLLIVLATVLALRLCELVQGTSSCGGPGFFLLLAILVLGVLAGSFLLRLGRVPDAGSTSLLGVALTSVVSLLFLVDHLFAWWMIIAIPLVSVGAFALSHWVTTTFSDD